MARKPKFGGRGPRQDRTERKRLEATNRNAAWAMLSETVKLDWLDSCWGGGQGASRQRARLQRGA
jgi:hypothetical protein